MTCLDHRDVGVVAELLLTCDSDHLFPSFLEPRLQALGPPPVDIRTQNSPLHLLVLLCLSPAWLSFYIRTFGNSKLTCRHLRSDFYSSLAQLLYRTQLCLALFSWWRTVVFFWWPEQAGFWLTSALSNFVVGFNLAFVYRTLSYSLYAVRISVLSFLAFATYCCINMWRWLTAERFYMSVLLGATAFFIFFMKSHSHHRLLHFVQAFGISAVVTFAALCLGVAPVAAFISACQGLLMGFCLVPALPGHAPRVQMHHYA